MKGKTNVMRMLDAAKIAYRACEYEVDENNLAGTHIAEEIGLPYEKVYKTLVARGDKTGPVVFVIPCHLEIDLKKAAKETGNKRIEMIPVKDLLGLTGYIRGGCSPIGMKKKFPTFISHFVTEQEEITVSAGVRGIQLLLNKDELVHFVGAKCADITILLDNP